jgi:HEAT repeat protein
VLAVEKGATAWAAARALAMTRDPSAEVPLLRALRDGPRDLRLAAAVALGAAGTAAAVAPLREAESGDAEMRRAARQAVAEIQARAVGAAPGQLSLTGGEAGQLSLASDEEGRLSLAEAPPGGRRASPPE